LPGQYFDAESGLHYNTYRDYDPRLGRYIESDPIGLAGGVNTYAYVGNNPVGLVDPSGLLFEWMGGPWTGFGSDISTPGNFSAAFEGAASGYGLGSGLTALAKLGKAVDAALPNCPVAAKGMGPTVGGGAKLENLTPSEITRIQNAANRTGTEISVVGSRANGTTGPLSDWDYVIPESTRGSAAHSLKSSLPEGPRSLGEPRNQDFFRGTVDSNLPYITFTPR
jgi:RHS repeat-associated protein